MMEVKYRIYHRIGIGVASHRMFSEKIFTSRRSSISEARLGPMLTKYSLKVSAINLESIMLLSFL